MDIKYLKKLENNIKREPMLMTEIGALENLYNGGNSFPTALRELLFLAGNSCYVLDYGIDGSIQSIQQKARGRLSNNNRSISRPFFVIDVYNSVDQFLFVYLDENLEDPLVYEAYFPSDDDDRGWLHSLEASLSAFVTDRISMLEQGYNPF